ncbi:uncharacterized protein LOC100187106 [Ciona intestinalis]
MPSTQQQVTTTDHPDDDVEGFTIFAPIAITLGVVFLGVSSALLICRYFKFIAGAGASARHRANTGLTRENLGNSQIVYRVNTGEGAEHEPSYQEIEVRVSICSVSQNNSERSPSRPESKTMNSETSSNLLSIPAAAVNETSQPLNVENANIEAMYSVVKKTDYV